MGRILNCKKRSRGHDIGSSQRRPKVVFTEDRAISGQVIKSGER